MPSRMEEIAARSATSGDEYRANKAENDRLASSYRKERKAENGKRKANVKKATVPERGPSTYAEMVKRRTLSRQPVLSISPAPPAVYTSKPDDLADYSLPPASVLIPYEIMPQAGALVGILPLIGSLLVYAGKQLLVSMALTGLESALAAPVFQKAQRNSNIAIRYRTGKPGKKGSTRVGPRAYGHRHPDSVKTMGNTSEFEEWTGDFLGVGRGD